jgi:hypothetical protein
VLDALQNKLGFSIKDLQRWLEKNGPLVADRLIEGIEQLWHAADWIRKKLEELIDFLIQLDKATDGWSTKLIGLAVVLKATGAGSLVGGVLSLAAAFVRVGAGIGLATTALAGFAAFEAWQALQGKETLISKLADSAVQGLSGAKYGSIGDWLYSITHRGLEAQQFFQNRGWTPQQAAGIVARMQLESGMSASAQGDNGQAYGLMSWHKDRQAAFAQRYGHAMQQGTYDEELDFANYELTRGAHGSAVQLYL